MLKDLTVEIATAGKTLTFAGARAIDLVDHVFGSVRQRNAYVQDPDIPLTVFFRPDVTSDRVEIVVKWGDVLSKIKPYTLAYRAQIKSAGKVLWTQEVKHYWLTRWRYQSAPRPVIHPIAELKATHRVPPYRRRDAHQVPPRHAPAYDIMGLSNVTPGMGATGERFDIGPYHEYAAYYVATEDSAYLPDVLAWGEAAASIPWHGSDETMAPVDFFAAAQAGVCYYPGHGLNYQGPSTDPNGKSPVGIDPAHWPELSTLPYLLTGDLYFLENLQMQANWAIGGNPMTGHGVFPNSVIREWTWCHRAVMNAAICTKLHESQVVGGITKTLKPSAYFERALATNKTWFDRRWMQSPARLQKNLHIFIQRVPPLWQHDYASIDMLSFVYQGRTDWAQEAWWLAYSALERTRGSYPECWDRTMPSAYYATSSHPLPADPDGRQRATFPDGSKAVVYIKKGALVTDHINPATAGAWVIDDGIANLSVDGKLIVGPIPETFADWFSLQSVPPNPTGNLYNGGGVSKAGSDYCILARAVVALAAKLGNQQAQAQLAWLEDQMDIKAKQNAYHDWVIPWRWSF